MNITSISRSSNIMTVTTASAHGFSVGQSVTQSGVTDGTFNGVFTVDTVPNSTTYTIKQTGANVSSTGGTTLATKQIIVLGNDSSQPGKIIFQLLYWFPIAAGNELPLPNRSSLFTRATADENAAISAGRLVEMQDSLTVPNTYNTSQITAFLQTMYSAVLAEKTSDLQAGQYYGYYFDGSSWPRA